MRIGQTRTAAPAAAVLSINEAKAALRVDHSSEDALIEALVQAATDMIEAATGRALITQTWRFDTWGLMSGDAMHLPRLPLAEVTAIGYYDESETLQSASVDDYRLIADDWRAVLEPIAGQQWPQTAERADAIRVTATAGYGDAATDVPEPLRHALRLLVAHWYQHREAVTVGSAGAVLPLGVEHLLSAYRTSWVQG